jgi:hypothetical protein
MRQLKTVVFLHWCLIVRFYSSSAIYLVTKYNLIILALTVQPSVGRRHHLAREPDEHQPILERLPARQHDLHVQVLLHRPGELRQSGNAGVSLPKYWRRKLLPPFSRNLSRQSILFKPVALSVPLCNIIS